MKNRIAVIVPLLLAGVAIAYWMRPSGYCDKAYERYGIKVPVCPAGTPQGQLSVWGRELKRGGDGEIEIFLGAHYTTAKSDEALQIPMSKFRAELFLVDASGTETPLPTKKAWQKKGDSKTATIVLPTVDDGDYILRAKTKSKLGEHTADLRLGLYAPARVHVLTDRPLYEPGNTVKFRGLALRATDLAPIDNRPGVWRVTSPSGEVLLEEKAPAGEWGVAQGDFPLAEAAENGTWTVAWESGGDQGSTTFRVEPFELPRFRVETASDKSVYFAGDEPRVRGAVVYSSGAPVANAAIEIRWSADGAWPPPSSWIAGGELPKSATTLGNGEFLLELPKVPADLRGKVTLRAYIAAVDPAGDRVAGSASVLLSEDAISAEAVTELEGGLVANTNNRVYLRVTDATGRPLAGAALRVKRAWAPGDEGIEATADADGVARIQFDPGRPVNIVVPPMPVRKSLRQNRPGGSTLVGLRDLVTNEAAKLADHVAVEGWLADLQSCSTWVRHGTEDAELSVRVSPAGALSVLPQAGSRVGACIAKALSPKRLPSGNDRLYAMRIRVTAADLPTLNANVSGNLQVPSELESAMNQALDGGRTCFPTDISGELPWKLFWSTSAKSSAVSIGWMKKSGAQAALSASAANCITQNLRGLSLASPAAAPSMGIASLYLSQPGRQGEQARPQATIMQGYELAISASVGGEDVGETTLRMHPGTVPDLRLRATPVMANAGDVVELAFFRGPDFVGELPREIRTSHEGAHDVIKLEKEAKTASFKVPEGAKGWYEFRAGGARALVFVASNEDLQLSLAAEKASYKPGEQATIAIQTNVAGKGAKAAVGLFGVDNSLAQIATLRGPDDLGSVRPEISMHEKAFGSLDAQALSLGRIRGRHAAEATILRVSSVPEPEALDRVIYESAHSEFEPVAVLTDNFYIALAELHVQTRIWEQTAKEGVLMTPEVMAKLWKKALAATKKKGQPAVDVYGRSLRLHWLPSDLLALVAPAQVVADATRLPEDVENWQQWVEEKRP